MSDHNQLVNDGERKRGEGGEVAGRSGLSGEYALSEDCPTDQIDKGRIRRNQSCPKPQDQECV